MQFYTYKFHGVKKKKFAHIKVDIISKLCGFSKEKEIFKLTALMYTLTLSFFLNKYCKDWGVKTFILYVRKNKKIIK